MPTSDDKSNKEHDIKEKLANIFPEGPDGKSRRLFVGHIVSAVPFNSAVVAPR